jgi:hypothetical protein
MTRRAVLASKGETAAYGCAEAAESGTIRHPDQGRRPDSSYLPPDAKAVPSIESTRLTGRIPFIITERFTMRDRCARGVLLRDERAVRRCDTWMRHS